MTPLDPLTPDGLRTVPHIWAVSPEMDDLEKLIAPYAAAWTADRKHIEALEKPVDVEAIAEKVHIAYCEQYKRRKGEPYWTNGDYSKLDEATKEYDRVTVHAVLAALRGEEET